MTEQNDDALVEELRAYFRKPQYTLPPYVDDLFDRIEAALSRKTSAKADAERLAERVIRAWETLSEGYYSSSAIQRWLVNDMKPAIDELRATYREKHNG